MGYNIEVSFNILKNRNTSEMEKEIISIANDNLCADYYNYYEMENAHIPRNHCVFSVVFKQQHIPFMLNFLRDVKKRKGLYVESIYDENENKLIYASPYYLSTMNKEGVSKYKQNKKERSYSEDEITILNEIVKEKN